MWNVVTTWPFLKNLAAGSPSPRVSLSLVSYGSSRSQVLCGFGSALVYFSLVVLLKRSICVSVCGCSCRFPGWLSCCPGYCTRPPNHECPCICPHHLANPWLRPFEVPQVRDNPPVPPSSVPGNFAGVVHLLQATGMTHRALEARALGVRDMSSLKRISQSDQSLEPWLLHLAKKAKAEESRLDHRVLDFSSRRVAICYIAGDDVTKRSKCYSSNGRCAYSCQLNT